MTQLGNAGVRVRSLGGAGLALAFARLARILRRERYDVVNAYGFKASVVVRALVNLTAPGTAFVCGVRGLHVSGVERIDSTRSRLLLLIERIGSRFVDMYDANSPGAVNLLASAGIDRSKLRWIANGIDVSRWNAPTREAGVQVPVVACVARFTPLKRHEDLLRAAAYLSSAGVPYSLLLVGTGPTYADMRRLAATFGLSDNVTFAGEVPRDQIPKLLAKADVFCLPSPWEGMPVSVMEAMASGLPVVATRVNGIDVLVEDGQTGLLVPPERPAELATALRAVLEDGEARRRLGERGRARVAAHFGVERMVAAKTELYTTVARS